MQQKPSILIAEDDKDDAYFIYSTFKESELFESIALVDNGEALLKHLNSIGSRLPDIILTDLNMPKMTGFEVLESIRESPHLCSIPVIVFSTSDNPGIINRCIRLGARSFLIKPFEIGEYDSIPEKIVQIFKDCGKA